MPWEFDLTLSKIWNTGQDVSNTLKVEAEEEFVK